LQWLDRHRAQVENAAASLIILVVAALVISAITRIAGRLMLRMEMRFHVPSERKILVERTVAAILWVCTGLITLSLWGVSVGGLWTFLVSVITLIGVGFLATWTMVSNVTANFFLTVWRPFHIGEPVTLLPEQLMGRVVDRNLMFTMLREPDGATLMIPNNLFFQKAFRVGGDIGSAQQPPADVAEAPASTDGDHDRLHLAR
jgi:small-conductance mechanosensitive channel